MDGSSPEKAVDGNDIMAEKGFDPEKATKNTMGGNNKKPHETRKRLFRDTINQLVIGKKDLLKSGTEL